MEGLAQELAGAQAQPQQQGRMPSVAQIVELLMQGMDPEELVAQGVPAELIMQAIDMIEQQMASQPAPQQQQAAGMGQDPGLAQSMMGM